MNPMNHLTRLFSPVLVFLLLSFTSFAQPAPATDSDLPTDYLPKEFHAGRREALRNLMPENSVVVIFAYPTRTYSNDVEYIYHANPDMYYFSGYKEPHSVLIIFKEKQTDSLGNSYDELLFVQKRDPRAEQWTGKRLGTEGARTKLGFSTVYTSADFKNFPVSFNKFTKIIFDKLPDDMGNNASDADLFDLVKQFRQKAGVPDANTFHARYDNRTFTKLTAQLR